jgi:hypothetical protein
MNYNRSEIMNRAHELAILDRADYNTYREALSAGMKQAWEEAKRGMVRTVEKPIIIKKDVELEFAQHCLGNIEGVDVAC